MPQGSYARFCPELRPGLPLSLHVTGWNRLSPQGWADIAAAGNQAMNGAPVSRLRGEWEAPRGTPLPRPESGARLSATPRSASGWTRSDPGLFLFERVRRWCRERRDEHNGLRWTSHSLEVCVHEAFSHLVSWKADNLGSSSFWKIC